MDKLNILIFFVHVAEQGSFTSAAKILGTDPSTISKAVTKLEQSIGVQLFQRTTRRLHMTDAGRHYLHYVKPMIEGLDQCEQKLLDDSVSHSGRLKINVPVSYGRQYVEPMVSSFCKQYPEISIELSFDDVYTDMLEHGYDIAFRTGRLPDSRFIARHLSSMDFVTLAAPSYLQQKNLTRFGLREFEYAHWIRFRFKQSGKLHPIYCCRKNNLEQIEVNDNYIVDDGESMIALSKAGLGVTQVPHFIARKALLDKTLVPIYKTFSSPDLNVYIIYPRRDFLPERVRLFVDHAKVYVNDLNECPTGTWALQLRPFSNVGI